DSVRVHAPIGPQATLPVVRHVSAPLTPAESHAPQQAGPELAVAGSIGVSTNGTDFYGNFGGPNVVARYGRGLFGLGFFPSLKLADGDFSPALGWGPFAGYKWARVVVPFYMIEGRMKPTFGVGVAR